MALAAAFAWTIGTDWFDQVFAVAELNRTRARPALIVFALSAVAFVVAVINASLATANKPTLNIRIERTWDAYISAAFAIAVGVLIGTTIFK
jgi:uncharacterized membrane protein